MDIEFEQDAEGTMLLHLHCARMIRRKFNLYVAVGFPREHEQVQRLLEWHDEAMSQAIDWAMRLDSRFRGRCHHGEDR